MEYVTRANQMGYFTDQELRQLRRDKVAAKISDTDYVSAHPEIQLIIQDLYVKVLQAKPDGQDVFRFVAEYFKRLNEERCAACE